MVGAGVCLASPGCAGGGGRRPHRYGRDAAPGRGGVCAVTTPVAAGRGRSGERLRRQVPACGAGTAALEAYPARRRCDRSAAGRAPLPPVPRRLATSGRISWDVSGAMAVQRSPLPLAGDRDRHGSGGRCRHCGRARRSGSRADQARSGRSGGLGLAAGGRGLFAAGRLSLVSRVADSVPRTGRQLAVVVWTLASMLTYTVWTPHLAAKAGCCRSGWSRSSTGWSRQRQGGRGGPAGGGRARVRPPRLTRDWSRATMKGEAGTPRMHGTR